MSKRRRIGGGIVPIDRIMNTSLNSSDIEADQTPQHSPPRRSIQRKVYSKRYKEVRRDQKVVNDINNSIIKEFVPDLNAVPKTSIRKSQNDYTNHNSASMVTDKDLKQYDRRLISSPKSGNEVHVIDEDEDKNNSYESRPSSPAIKRPNSSGKGLLESSPYNTSNYKYLVKMMGTLKIIGPSSVKHSFEHITLAYEFGNKDCYINFINKGVDLFSKPISLKNDCGSLFFADGYASIGILLKEQEIFYVETNERNYKIKTKTLLWNNDNSVDSDGLIRMESIRSTLSIKCKTEILNQQKDMIEKLMLISRRNLNLKNEYTAKEAVSDLFKKHPSVKQNFLEKSSFRSLNPHSSTARRKHTSVLGTDTATKIQIPNHNTELRENVGGAQNISAKSFYSNVPVIQNIETDSNKLQLNIRRSTRFSNIEERPKTYNLDSFDDDDEPYEVPEQFKPTLYQKFHDGTSYTVTNQDFKCLYNKDWINDSIIEFFVKYYIEVSISKSIIKREEVYIMSSFFYSKLTSEPNNLYENVRKWVQNADLLNRKYVVIPMNVNYHWYGCIITNLDVYLKFVLSQQNAEKHSKDMVADTERTERSDTESVKTGEALPCNDANDSRVSEIPNDTDHSKNRNETESCEPKEEFTDAQEHSITDLQDEITLSYPTIEILTFDSLGGTHTREVDPIKEFIIGYAKDKYGLIIDKSYLKMKKCPVPQQPNMSDCGVHVILTIKKFFEDPLSTMEVWRNSKIRGRISNKIINQYFEKAERNKKRKALREVLKDLLADQVNRTGYTSAKEEENEEDEDDEAIEIIEGMPQQFEHQNADDGNDDDNRSANELENQGNFQKKDDILDETKDNLKDQAKGERKKDLEDGNKLKEEEENKDEHENLGNDFTFEASSLPSSARPNEFNSDPPSIPNRQSENIPTNLPVLETETARSSSSPILPPRDSDVDIAIPSEAIADTDFLESSPTKYRNIHQIKKTAEPTTSRFFDQPRLALRRDHARHGIVPILGIPINIQGQSRRLLLSSPTHDDGASQNDGSHSVIISDNDEDVKLVKNVEVASPFNSEKQVDRRGTAEIISEKVKQELNNNDIHETYRIEGKQSNVSSQDTDATPTVSHSPVPIHYNHQPPPLSETISLDDD